jgi:hypothetical protein
MAKRRTPVKLFRWAFFALIFVARFALIVAGWVLPVHIMYKTERTEGMNLLERYWENSWRNPTPYLRSVFRQPEPEVKPNPDLIVRTGIKRKASRLMESGLYIEYWSLSAMDNGKFWEFRIGWKFVDGEDTFWPTLQLGPKR